MVTGKVVGLQSQVPAGQSAVSVLHRVQSLQGDVVSNHSELLDELSVAHLTAKSSFCMVVYFLSAPFNFRLR